MPLKPVWSGSPSLCPAAHSGPLFPGKLPQLPAGLACPPHPCCIGQSVVFRAGTVAETPALKPLGAFPLSLTPSCLPWLLWAFSEVSCLPLTPATLPLTSAYSPVIAFGPERPALWQHFWASESSGSASSPAPCLLWASLSELQEDRAPLWLGSPSSPGLAHRRQPNSC